ncbi:hypothetical protein [Streptomyces nanshensis]|uniref:Uncharacterized protein n=1 Tax=Streptomyces nanshensis TaxID=518642 RepID=A0A1E7LCZ5_9ACTN|nr:hypothetical protein [Streptomyces nanshensis]OEV14077.1 hypothetical protein AN218_00970 [Streptomyces nanshensis]
MNAPPQKPHPVPAHIPAHLHDAFAWTKGGELPEHCPYQIGDAVKIHGFPGHPDPGFGRTGFRGWVVGTVGATILTGITTAGEEWWEEWGRLEPADAPVKLSRWCTCCADHRRAAREAALARQTARGEQLGLFTRVA